MAKSAQGLFAGTLECKSRPHCCRRRVWGFQTLSIECVDGLVKPQDFYESFFGYSFTCVKRSLWPSSMVMFGKAYLPVWLLKNNHQVLLCRKKGASLQAW